MSKRRASYVLGATLWAACASPQKPFEPTPPSPAPTAQGGSSEVVHPPAPGLGGRLFDDWARELRVDFVPDDPSTPEPDGRGGPFGNGTLPDREGRPLLNTGHDYRLKNLFGWDLRGAEGIYGPPYEHKAQVLLPDLLRNTEGREVWIQRLEQGEDAIPAYGSMLSRPQIEAVVDFLLSVRDGGAPQPGDLFALSQGTPGSYRLLAGGDAERGVAYFTQTCAHCHGSDGTSMLLEEGSYSLGGLMRARAYETWVKIVSGQPGSDMHAQVPTTMARADQVQLLLDLHAALCDRTRYPRGLAPTEDVVDGDPRCGEYLR